MQSSREGEARNDPKWPAHRREGEATAVNKLAVLSGAVGLAGGLD
jgi:hypothetical protein